MIELVFVTISLNEIVTEGNEIVIESKMFYHDFLIKIVMESTKIIESILYTEGSSYIVMEYKTM